MENKKKTILVEFCFKFCQHRNQVQGHVHPDTAGGGSARGELDPGAGARRGGRTWRWTASSQFHSSDSSAFRALRVAVTPDNKWKYSEQRITLINIQCLCFFFFFFFFFFFWGFSASRAVYPSWAATIRKQACRSQQNKTEGGRRRVPDLLSAWRKPAACYCLPQGKKSSPCYCVYCAELHAGMLIVCFWGNSSRRQFLHFHIFRVQQRGNCAATQTW